MSKIIEVHSFTKTYGDQVAVDNISFDVDEGSVFAFLGPNGAGKSTTIKMLLGMVHPDYGHCELFGENSAELRPETRARIAY